MSSPVPIKLKSDNVTIEVWNPGNGQPLTINVKRKICEDWYNSATMQDLDDGRVKLRGVRTGRLNHDKLDGLFYRLKRTPGITHFVVEHDVITLRLGSCYTWRNVQASVRLALQQSPYGPDDTFAFVLHG